MERSNPSPKTEGGPVEGQAPDLWYFRVERRRGSVPKEPLRPQAGVAPGLSNSASIPCQTADGDKVVNLEPNMTGAAQGEATDSLPGSQRVAPEERVDRNLGDRESSRRTNYERPAGRVSQRQEGLPGSDPGVGFVQRSPEQGHGPDLGQGTNLSTQPAQAPSPVRMTGQSWPTFLRAIADKAAQDKHHRFGDLYRHLNPDALRHSFYRLR